MSLIMYILIGLIVIFLLTLIIGFSRFSIEDEMKRQAKAVNNVETQKLVENTARAVKKGLTEENNMTYCRYCGKEIEADSKFCRYCGKEQ